MTPEAAAAFTFTDFHGLAALKRDAARETPEAKRAVAQQFESLFLGLVLEEMRAAGTIGGGLFDGDGVRFYQDLYDRQLALALSRGRGIGLADAIYRELGGDPEAADAAANPVVPGEATARGGYTARLPRARCWSRPGGR